MVILASDSQFFVNHLKGKSRVRDQSMICLNIIEWYESESLFYSHVQ